MLSCKVKITAMFLPKRTSILLRIALGAALGGALLWWLLHDINAQTLINHLIDFSWERLVPVILLIIASGIVRAYRWRLLFHGAAPSVSRLFFVENTGIGFNSAVPVRILAEPIQFGYLTLRDGYSRGAVLASLVLGRVVDLTVTLVTITIGLSLFPPEGAARQLLWTSTLLGIGLAAGVALFSLTIHRWRWPRRFRLLTTYGAAWRELMMQPHRLVQILALTSVQWALIGLGAWIIAQDLGLGLSFPVIYVLTLGVMILGFTIPGLPSGLGPFEFAATVLLAVYGISREPALAFGLILHGALLLPPVVIAITTLAVHGPPWSASRSARGSRASASAPAAAVSRTGPGAEKRR